MVEFKSEIEDYKRIMLKIRDILRFDKGLQGLLQFDKVWCNHIALSTVRFIMKIQ